MVGLGCWCILDDGCIMIGPEALSWFDNIRREKWTQAYDGGCRWGHMTSNLAEAMNSVFKDIRNQPITALVQATYYKCGELFGRRGEQSAAVVASGQGYMLKPAKKG
ncbi:hypothetical protein QL285_068277 [Trifolium repens]|nr:hypothetical protein QL285_068277 [Trifolium repens]